MSTFIMMQTMLATVAVTDTQNASGTVSFNGTTVGWQSGSGVEIPIGQNWSMVLEGAVEGTLIGASASAGTSNAALSVSAFSMLMGVAIRP
jgi:hypothetical protein